MLALLEAQTFESGYFVDWDKSRETTTLGPSRHEDLELISCGERGSRLPDFPGTSFVPNVASY